VEEPGKKAEAEFPTKFATKFATKAGTKVAAKVLERGLASVGFRRFPWAGFLSFELRFPIEALWISNLRFQI
jgi:hypothetical protein